MKNTTTIFDALSELYHYYIKKITPSVADTLSELSAVVDKAKSQKVELEEILKQLSKQKNDVENWKLSEIRKIEMIAEKQIDDISRSMGSIAMDIDRLELMVIDKYDSTEEECDAVQSNETHEEKLKTE